MGRRRKFPRLGPVTWIVAFLAVATLAAPSQAAVEQPQLVTQAHEEKPFRIDVPEGWSVQWDYPLGPARKAELVAFGPVEDSFRTNVGVASESAVVESTDEYLLAASDKVFEAVNRADPATIVRPSAIVETTNAHAAVFVIVYKAVPVSQVIATVASQDLSQVWTIVGTTAVETADRNEPLFQSIIASFEIVASPSPALSSPVGSPLLISAIAGSTVLLGAWVLYRRRHEFIALVRTLRDEGRIPGQLEMPPEDVGAIEVIAEIPGDRR